MGKIRIGIFFGGISREREISFVGGRTVYENLDRALFEAIPIFVDSLGNFIILDEQYIYANSIRDFYPPLALISKSPFRYYIESSQPSESELMRNIALIGTRLHIQDLKKHIDFAFIAMHGPHGEDGSLQGLLEWLGIPYSGCGMLASAIGIDKVVQNTLIGQVNGQEKTFLTLNRKDWLYIDKADYFEEIKSKIGLPIVIKAPHQGSSIGVSIVSEDSLEKFVAGVNQCFFSKEIQKKQWTTLNYKEKINFMNDLCDLGKGIGLPVVFEDQSQLGGDLGEIVFAQPAALLEKLNEYFEYAENSAVIYSTEGESQIMFENFIHGREFTCAVIQDENGKAISLLPSEIIKHKGFFDFASKYQTNDVEEIIVMQTEDEDIKKIQQEASKVFESLNFNVYVRIDGFLTADKKIFLQDPNTIPGMSPTSFIFKQFAEIGFSATQTINYLIRTSLQQRVFSGKRGHSLRNFLEEFDAKLENHLQEKSKRKKVAIILGGFTSQKYDSLAIAKKVFTKISASENYEPLVFFLTGTWENHQLYQIPINLLFRDHLNQVEKGLYSSKNKFVEDTIEKTSHLAKKYVGKAIFEPEKMTYLQMAKIVNSAFLCVDEDHENKDFLVKNQIKAVKLRMKCKLAKEDYL
ncbi:MAG: D-alanine--D-alanine ligase [Bacteroidetes bacterium]|nr:MAG: D-alanine--D-alanine ligase [Bacteroidota bacterium]